MIGMDRNRKRITLDVDGRLLAAVDAAAAERQTSRSRFLTEAVREILRARERERVDAAFARMADDPAYRAELRRIEAGMARASDAAWRKLDGAEATTGRARRTRRGRSHHAAR